MSLPGRFQKHFASLQSQLIDQPKQTLRHLCQVSIYPQLKGHLERSCIFLPPKKLYVMSEYMVVVYQQLKQTIELIQIQCIPQTFLGYMWQHVHQSRKRLELCIQDAISCKVISLRKLLPLLKENANKWGSFTTSDVTFLLVQLCFPPRGNQKDELSVPSLVCLMVAPG